MAADTGPGPGRRRVRDAVRAARLARGLTQQQAAAALDWSLSKMTRMETGAVGVSVCDLRALLGLYQVSEAETGPLIEMARTARTRPWFTRYPVAGTVHGLARYLDAETSASAIAGCRGLAFPGLLQTADYARAVLTGLGAARVDERVDLLLARQRLLDRDDCPDLRFILDLTDCDSSRACRSCTGRAGIVGFLLPTTDVVAGMCATGGMMHGGRPVIGKIRVQEIVRGDGRRAYTIVMPDGEVCAVADLFLRQCRGGTDRTYAYLLVDHLRWLESEGLAPETVAFPALERYMAAVGAEYAGPSGRPWREGKRPYGQSALATAAACLKRFYLFQGSQGLGREVAETFRVARLPSRADRRRVFLGHVVTDMPANPLAPPRPRRRHPKMPPEGARKRLIEALGAARDRMTVVWLADGGFRVGELCGLHLTDLHLREAAGCGECRPPHVHICHREANPNRARAKTKPGWRVEDGIVRGGLIRRASPAMIHTYFEYMMTEYPAEAGHGMLLVQLYGPRAGEPWATAGVRGMLRRAGVREEMGRIRPHQWRHGFATNVLDAAGGNAVIARDAGGWASAATVEQVYGHADVHDPVFAAALARVWDEQL